MRAALLALLAALAAGEKPPVLVTYELEESLRSVTPQGERVVAIGGRVARAGERARLDLVGSRFPRSRASALVVDGEKLLLLDTKEKESASLPADELDSLFTAPASQEASGAGSRVREKTITVEPAGPGRAFQGLASQRWRVTLNVWHSVTLPGRVSAVHEVTRGVVETVPELEDARSRLDDLLRLFRARGEVRDELAQKLAQVEGFPVLVTLDGEVEVTSEALTGGSADRPVRTTTHVSREVHRLAKRAWKGADEALFHAPDAYRSRGPERMLDGGAALR